MLRRAFCSIDSMERRRLLQVARRAPAQDAGERTSGSDDGQDSAAFARALPLLKTILGLEGA